MQQLFTTCLALAMNQLRDLASKIRLENADESTFRSLLVREIMLQEPSAWCETEWSRKSIKRIDLYVAFRERQAVVELKFYVHRGKYNVDRKLEGWKGGPSSKNEAEFRRCLKKLAAQKDARITDRFLVLVYKPSNPKDLNSKNSYGNSYDDLGKYGILSNQVTEVDHAFDGLACKLIKS